ncbi:MAG: hypothetical protein OTJ98_00345 [Dehalococcoidia bacterium]|jgi:hypothetical protein|nr:hypothetical protein [Dehalococcoidia bacterium]
MGVLLRILVPILLFPLLRWGVPRFLSWVGRRYDIKQAEKRSGGPVIEGRMTDEVFPTRDLRYVEFDQ